MRHPMSPDNPVNDAFGRFDHDFDEEACLARQLFNRPQIWGDTDAT